MNATVAITGAWRPTPGQFVDVTSGELTVDDADDEEERRLEQRVTDDQRETGEGCGLGAVADHDDEEAELTHRAEGEHAFEVCLAQRLDAAQQHGEHPERNDDRAPGFVQREDRREAGDQVDAGLHHGRGVQVRAHRCRSGHGSRKPEMEREDRRFAQRPDQEHHDRGIHHRAGRPDLEDVDDAGGSGIHGQQDDADEHHQTTERGHQQRLQSCTAAGGAAPVVADEQVGQDAGDFPEHHEHDDVVGEHQTVHRAGETEQNAGELAEFGGVVEEVPAAVQQHQRADAGDDEGEHPAQHVHMHGEVQTELRDPGDALERRRIPCEDLRRHHERVDECRCGNERGDRERLSSQPAHQRGENEGPHEEHSKEHDHRRLLNGSSALRGAGGQVCASLPGRASRLERNCSVRGGARGRSRAESAREVQ